MIHETRAIAAEGETIDIGPFAFWPDLASRLVGMGGEGRGDDPDYAFHTLYVSCGSGPIVFTVRFAGLIAQRGTLIMRIHELPEVMGAHARQIAISQTQLSDLIRGDGHTSLAAIARAGNSYALLGHIYGDTLASADAVAIEVARRTPDAQDPSNPTRFRADPSRITAAPQIVGEREGTMVTPVSQLCTMRQIAEPIVATVLEQMGGMQSVGAIARWEHAYLARVLDRYDVARSGARGLGIGAIAESGTIDPLTLWVASQGCALTLTVRDAVPADLDLPPHCAARALDPTNIDDLEGFDFAWATRVGGVGGHDRQAILRFIEDVLRTLKPGGLLTLVVPIDVAPREIGDDAGPMIRRPDIDRIVLLLLSRGHQVAQICPWGEAMAVANQAESLMVSAFGLIIRKAV